MAGNIHKLATLDEVAQIEKVSDKVSEKYVPIYTSEVIEHLQPEFAFKHGVRYYKFNNAHSVFLDFQGANISIENSYDRSRAFSFKYNDGDITIPLNLNRQLHIGEKAKVVVNDISINKNELIKAIANAKSAVVKLKSTPATPAFRKAIRAIVYKQPMEKDNFLSLNNEDVAESYKTVYGYVNALIKKYEEGNYMIVQKNSKTGAPENRQGRKSSSAFLKLQMTNSIYESIQESFPEAFI